MHVVDPEDDEELDEEVLGGGSSILQLATSVSLEPQASVLLHVQLELALFGPSFGQPAVAQHFVPLNVSGEHSICGSVGPGPFQYAEQ